MLSTYELNVELCDATKAYYSDVVGNTIINQKKRTAQRPKVCTI